MGKIARTRKLLFGLHKALQLNLHAIVELEGREEYDLHFGAQQNMNSL